MSLYNFVSPRKRKCKEFQDPDYPKTSQKTVDDYQTKLKRVRGIIVKEFDREIAAKKQQLDEISNRLVESRRLLDSLRYKIVSQYYKCQEQNKATSDSIRSVRREFDLLDAATTSTALQPNASAIHPAVKRIIGKRPCSLSDLLKACPKRMAAVNASKPTIIKQKDDAKQHTLKSWQQRRAAIAALSTKTTQEIDEHEQSPKKALNSFRLGNKIKHYIVIGNTSKFIRPDSLELYQSGVIQNGVISHKWIVYIQSKDVGSPLETFVHKVRFYLDPSYRPRDIVDVYGPSFQLARHGWGEFPIRIKLFFHAHLQQKPVQMVHHLVLDKTSTGFHKLGAETIVELWLPVLERTESTPALEIKSENMNKAEKIEIIMPCVGNSSNSSATNLLNHAITTGSALQGSSIKPEEKSLELTTMCNNEKHENRIPTTSYARVQPASVLKHPPGKRTVFHRDGKVYIIDPLQMKLKQQQIQQESLLKPQLTVFKQQQQHRYQEQQQNFYRPHLAEHDYADPIYLMSSRELTPRTLSYAKFTSSDRTTAGSLPVQLHFGLREKRIAVSDARELITQQIREFELEFKRMKFNSVRQSIEYLLRRLPLIATKTSLAASYTFVKIGEREFNALSGIRQRSNEWLRAKWIEKRVKKHCHFSYIRTTSDDNSSSPVWTTREILLFARQHAYTPPLKHVLSARCMPATMPCVRDEEKNNLGVIVKYEPMECSNTLTSPEPIRKWLAVTKEMLKQKKRFTDEQELINVMSEGTLPAEQHKSTHKEVTTSSLIWRVNVPELEHLRNELNIVHQITHSANYQLESDKVTDDILQPVSVSAVMAESLHLFINRLLRSAVAMKNQQSQSEGMWEVPFKNELNPEDICRAINNFTEFDFLSNRYLGIPKYCDS